MIEFDSISSEDIAMEEQVLKDLNTDQKYMFEIFQAIKNGSCSPSLAVKNPGKLNAARWLTTVNRFQRLYISTENPSQNFKKIVEFIMQVYVPTWFEIKRNSSICNGAINLFHEIQRARNQDDDVFEAVKPAIQRNAYFSHPENILLSMIADENLVVQELGWRRILKARDNEKTRSRSAGVRAFLVPKINFGATAYYNMIEWDDITELPLTKDFTKECSMDCLNRKQFDIELKFLNLPCHTQVAERHIKVFTEVWSLVSGQSQREGAVMTTLASRKKMPKFNFKSQFKV